MVNALEFRLFYKKYWGSSPTGPLPGVGFPLYEGHEVALMVHQSSLPQRVLKYLANPESNVVVDPGPRGDVKDGSPSGSDVLLIVEDAPEAFRQVARRRKAVIVVLVDDDQPLDSGMRAHYPVATARVGPPSPEPSLPPLGDVHMMRTSPEASFAVDLATWVEVRSRHVDEKLPHADSQGEMCEWINGVHVTMQLEDQDAVIVFFEPSDSAASLKLQGELHEEGLAAERRRTQP